MVRFVNIVPTFFKVSILYFNAFRRYQHVQPRPAPSCASLFNGIHERFLGVEGSVQKRIATRCCVPHLQQFDDERIVLLLNDLRPAGSIYVSYRRYFNGIGVNDIGHVFARNLPISKHHGCKGPVPFAMFYMLV